ncbi:MAG: hypothetical protein IT353_05535 [Gemmatimonadaceae bacterium]|nr:hypothetical protein [Gemmatimonadaceae bacterium]
MGRLSDVELSEASGFARGTLRPNTFWSQGDSGNEPVLFAFDSSGVTLGTTRVRDAENRDWEAIAIGVCPSGSCLYIGDVGDNGARRNTVRIWRIAEPQPGDSASTPAEQLVVEYPDGPRDVESMWVAPDSAVYLLTKRPEKVNDRWRAAQIYRLPADAWRANATITASLFDSLPIVPRKNDSRGWLTDAALSSADSSGGYRLVVRSYRDVSVWDIHPTTWHPRERLAHCLLTEVPEASSGEGVTWLADGRIALNHEGVRASLHAGRCP